MFFKKPFSIIMIIIIILNTSRGIIYTVYAQEPETIDCVSNGKDVGDAPSPYSQTSIDIGFEINYIEEQ